MVTLAVAPARADVRWTEGNFFESEVFLWRSRSDIDAMSWDGLDNTVTLESGLNLGGSQVSATNCVISTWVEVKKGANGTPWQSSSVRSFCMDAIAQGGRNRWHFYNFRMWGTSGDYAKGHLCVFLFYNNSSTTGWSRCREGSWVGL